MKIRTDFVTNSSSSSFIIAVKSGLTKAEAKDVVGKYFKTQIEELMGNTDRDDTETLEEEIKTDLVSKIMEAKSGMKLNDWRVSGGEAHSDDYNASCVLHMSGEFNSPKVKFKNVGC